MKVGKIGLGIAGVFLGLASAAEAETELNQSPAVEETDQHTNLCDKTTEIFVLSEDDPLLQCPADTELSSEQHEKCTKIVSCLLKNEMLIDASIIAKFNGIGDTESGGSSKMQLNIKEAFSFPLYLEPLNRLPK
jgi:hypothetical protein